MQETRVQSLGREDPLEKEMATHPTFLPGVLHGQRSLAAYSPGSCRVGQDWATNTFTFTFKKLTNYSPFSLFAQSCLTLRDPMGCSLPGSSVHGILQARILEWVAIPFSGGIFPTQGWNLCLLYCRQIPYRLSHQRLQQFSYVWGFTSNSSSLAIPSIFAITSSPISWTPKNHSWGLELVSSNFCFCCSFDLFSWIMNGLL